jgi:protein-disulfide isomerase
MKAKLTAPVGARDHRQGPDTALVTLVEYGDYECPYCGMAYPIVKAIQRRLGRKLRFVFRNFPLQDMHRHAFLAAEAAEAAGAQGRFWEMHDLLYEAQADLSPAAILRHAEGLDLDRERFVRDVDSHTFAERIDEDLRSGAYSGVNGTPTFFINGYRHDGPFDNESLLAAVVDAMGSADRRAGM